MAILTKWKHVRVRATDHANMPNNVTKYCAISHVKTANISKNITKPFNIVLLLKIMLRLQYTLGKNKREEKANLSCFRKYSDIL